MSVGGALDSGLTGLTAYGNAIAMYTDNIVNSDSTGYRAMNVHFSTLVTSDHSSVNYSSGGVTSSGRIRTTAGTLSATGSNTDLAIVQGGGFMIVNGHSDGSGVNYLTRAGSFNPDNTGAFVNMAGYTLMAWPLDSQGRLPGAPGNLNAAPSALMSSLVPVNLSNIGGASSATSNVSFQATLDQRSPTLPGAGETIMFPITNPVNNNMNLDSIIVPTANLHVGDDLVISTPNNSKVYTYGGFAVSNNITTGSGLFGVTQTSVPFSTISTPALSTGDTFTITTPSAGTMRFNFTLQGQQAAAGNFDTLENLARAMNETKVNGQQKLTARVVGGRLYVAPVNANEPMTITDVSGTIAATLGLSSTTLPGAGVSRFATMDGLSKLMPSTGLFGTTPTPSTTAATLKVYNNDPLQTITFGGRVSSYSNPFASSDAVYSGPVTASTPVLGATTTAGLFTGAVNGQHFSIAVGGAAPVTFTYNTALGAGQFDSLATLATLINGTAGFQASVVGSQLKIQPSIANAGQSLTFANGTGTFLTALGLVNSTNIGGAATTAGLFQSATAGDNLTLTDGLGNTVTLTYAAVLPNPALLNFNSLDTLVAAINTNANFVSYIEGNRIYIKPVHTQTGITFSSSQATSVNFPTVLGLTNNASLTNILTEFDLTAGTSGPAYDPQGATAPNMAAGTTVGPNYSSPFQIFDSFGLGHNFKVDFLKIGIDTWAIEITASNPADVVLSGDAASTGLVDYGTVTFNGDGTLQNVSGNIAQPMTISWNNQALDNVITLNWGTAGAASNAPVGAPRGGTDGLSQPAGLNNAFVTQDGVPTAERSAVYVDEKGIVTVTFMNGLNRQVFQIPMGYVVNPAGLKSADGNVFSVSIEAGGLNLRAAGMSGVGNFRAGYLEKSNVDLADELTSLVKAQRGYEASTQTIAVANDLLKELNRLFT